MSILRKKCCCPDVDTTPVWKWSPCYNTSSMPSLYGTEEMFERLLVRVGSVSIDWSYSDPCNPTYQLNAGSDKVLFLTSVVNTCHSSTFGDCGTLSFVGYMCPNAGCGRDSCYCTEYDNESVGCTPSENLVVIACGTEPVGWDNLGFGEIQSVDDFDPETHDGIWMGLGYLDGVAWDGVPFSHLDTDFEDIIRSQGSTFADCCVASCFTDNCDYIGLNTTITANPQTICSPATGGTMTIDFTSYYYDASTQEIVLEGQMECEWATGEFDDWCFCVRESSGGTACCSGCTSPAITVVDTWEARISACDIASVISGTGGTLSSSSDSTGASQDFCLFDLFSQGCPPSTPSNLTVASRSQCLGGTGTVAAVGYGASTSATLRFRGSYTGLAGISSCSIWPPDPVSFFCDVAIQFNLPDDPCP